jgi:hypothetical protein
LEMKLSQFLEDAKRSGVTDPKIIEAKTKQYIDRYGEFEPEESKKESSEKQRLKSDQEKREAYSNLPLAQRIALGIGKNAYSMSVAPIKRMMGKGDEVDADMEKYAQASQGDLPSRLGEIAGDVSLMALPGNMAFKGAKGAVSGLGMAGKFAQKVVPMVAGGLAEGAVSAGGHQLQNYGTKGDVDLGDAGLESAVSGVIPGATGLLSDMLKGAGATMLQKSVKPLKQYMNKRNAPQFAEPLKQGLVSKFGGIEKTYQNIEKKVGEISEVRDNAIQAANIKVNTYDAIKDAENILKQDLKKGRIDINDYNDAINSTGRVIEDIDYLSTKGIVDGPTAVQLRKNADKRSKFLMNVDRAKTPDEARFNEAFRQAIENQIDKKLNNVNGEIATAYRTAKKNLGRLVPVQKAILGSNPRLDNRNTIGLMDATMMNTAGQLGNTTPQTATAMLTGGLLNRLVNTQGGSAMVYGAGQQLGKENVYPKQILRSALFGE